MKYISYKVEVHLSLILNQELEITLVHSLRIETHQGPCHCVSLI